MKQRKVIGLFLLILGVAVCAAGLGIHILYLHGKYQGFLEHGYFDSFLHYYWAVGKANLVVSVLMGTVPAGIGIYFLRRK